MITLSSQSSRNRPIRRSKDDAEPRKTSKFDTISSGRQKSTINLPSEIDPAFEKARKRLRALSDKRLLDDLENLNSKERRIEILVLLHLSELEKRRLYLPLGFSSLFDFCIYDLGYTRATAARRIRAAKAAAEYPEAMDMLDSGEINITTLSMIADILDRDNYVNIFSEIRGKSTRAVELLVSKLRPERVSRDMIRQVCVMKRVQNNAASSASLSCAETSMHENAPAAPDQRRKSNKISSSAETNIMLTKMSQASQELLSGVEERPKCNKLSSSAETKPDSECSERLIFEEKFKLGFTVSPEFMIKYNKIISLLSSKHPAGLNFETLFEILMTEYLERHDPEKRRERRKMQVSKQDSTAKQASEKHLEARAKRSRCRDKAEKHAAKNTDESRIGEAGNRGKVKKRGRRSKIRESAHASRHIPTEVRDRVYARDKGRCTFVGANGKRCDSTWDLEIDHVVPFARGGDNSLGNLRLLCRKHNIYQAEQSYGQDFMKKYI